MSGAVDVAHFSFGSQYAPHPGDSHGDDTWPQTIEEMTKELLGQRRNSRSPSLIHSSAYDNKAEAAAGAAALVRATHTPPPLSAAPSPSPPLFFSSGASTPPEPALARPPSMQSMALLQQQQQIFRSSFRSSRQAPPPPLRLPSSSHMNGDDFMLPSVVLTPPDDEPGSSIINLYPRGNDFDYSPPAMNAAPIPVKEAAPPVIQQQAKQAWQQEPKPVQVAAVQPRTASLPQGGPAPVAQQILQQQQLQQQQQQQQAPPKPTVMGFAKPTPPFGRRFSQAVGAVVTPKPAPKDNRHRSLANVPPTNGFDAEWSHLVKELPTPKPFPQSAENPVIAATQSKLEGNSAAGPSRSGPAPGQFPRPAPGPRAPSEPQTPRTPKQQMRTASESTTNTASTKKSRRRTLSLSALFSRKKKGTQTPEMPPMPLPKESPDSRSATPGSEKSSKRRTLLQRASLKDLFGAANSDTPSRASRKSLRKSQSKPEMRSKDLFVDDNAPPVPSLPPMPSLNPNSTPAKPTVVPDALAALTGKAAAPKPAAVVPDALAALTAKSTASTAQSGPMAEPSWNSRESAQAVTNDGNRQTSLSRMKIQNGSQASLTRARPQLETSKSAPSTLPRVEASPPPPEPIEKDEPKQRRKSLSKRLSLSSLSFGMKKKDTTPAPELPVLPPTYHYAKKSNPSPPETPSKVRPKSVKPLPSIGMGAPPMPQPAMPTTQPTQPALVIQTQPLMDATSQVKSRSSGVSQVLSPSESNTSLTSIGGTKRSSPRLATSARVPVPKLSEEVEPKTAKETPVATTATQTQPAAPAAATVPAALAGTAARRRESSIQSLANGVAGSSAPVVTPAVPAPVAASQPSGRSVSSPATTMAQSNNPFYHALATSTIPATTAEPASSSNIESAPTAISSTPPLSPAAGAPVRWSIQPRTASLPLKMPVPQVASGQVNTPSPSIVTDFSQEPPRFVERMEMPSPTISGPSSPADSPSLSGSKKAIPTAVAVGAALTGLTGLGLSNAGIPGEQSEQSEQKSEAKPTAKSAAPVIKVICASTTDLPMTNSPTATIPDSPAPSIDAPSDRSSWTEGTMTPTDGRATASPVPSITGPVEVKTARRSLLRSFSGPIALVPSTSTGSLVNAAGPISAFSSPSEEGDALPEPESPNFRDELGLPYLVSSSDSHGTAEDRSGLASSASSMIMPSMMPDAQLDTSDDKSISSASTEVPERMALSIDTHYSGRSSPAERQTVEPPQVTSPTALSRALSPVLGSAALPAASIFASVASSVKAAVSSVVAEASEALDEIEDTIEDKFGSVRRRSTLPEERQDSYSSERRSTAPLESPAPSMMSMSSVYETPLSEMPPDISICESPSNASTTTFETCQSDATVSPESSNMPLAPYKTAESPPAVTVEELPRPESSASRRGSMPAALAATVARRRTSSSPMSSPINPSAPSMPFVLHATTPRSVSAPVPSSVLTEEPEAMEVLGRTMASIPEDRNITPPESPLALHMPPFVVPFPPNMEEISNTTPERNRSPTVTNYPVASAARERHRRNSSMNSSVSERIRLDSGASDRVRHDSNRSEPVRRDSGITSAVGGFGFARIGQTPDSVSPEVTLQRANAAVQRHENTTRNSIPTVLDYSARSAPDLSLWVETTTTDNENDNETNEDHDSATVRGIPPPDDEYSSGSDENSGSPCTPRTPDLEPSNSSSANNAQSSPSPHDKTVRVAREPFRPMHYDMTDSKESLSEAEESFQSAREVQV